MRLKTGMRSGILGFIGGVILMLSLAVIAQRVVIREVAPDLAYRFGYYVFSGTQFPTGDCEQGRIVRRCLFPVGVTVTFYNAQYEEVTQADKPGRYGAVVKISLNGGVNLQRFITLYRTPADVPWYGPWLDSVQLPAEVGIDPTVLHNQQQTIQAGIRQGFAADGNGSPDLAILLAGLADTAPTEPPMTERTDSTIRNARWWFGLRQRIGLAEKYQYLADLPAGYDADPAKRWPLIFYLHGGNEKGDDLQRVRDSGLPRLIGAGKQLPAVVISPQCPLGEDWNSAVLFQLLDEISAKYRIDPDRIYLTGISAGGDLVWDMAMEQPDRFAALAPMAGETDHVLLPLIKNIPTWGFQGLKDTIVPPNLMISMVSDLRAAGGHPHLTLFPDADHSGAWTRAYADEDLYTWLLAQKRGQPEALTPGLPVP
jgi:acetyl esterase/lipase